MQFDLFLPAAINAKQWLRVGGEVCSETTRDLQLQVQQRRR